MDEIPRVFGEVGISDRVTRAFLRQIYVKRSGSGDELLTVSELATRLRCEVKNIYALTRRRRANRGLIPLPHRKVGRKLLFSWRDVLDWLDKQPGSKSQTGGSR